MIDGLDLDAMIAGLMSASFITFWLNTVDDIPKAASAVLFSGLLSGVASPVVTTYAVASFPVLKGSGNSLPLLAAVLIGCSVTWGLPILINYFKNKWGNSNA